MLHFEGECVERVSGNEHPDDLLFLRQGDERVPRFARRQDRFWGLLDLAFAEERSLGARGSFLRACAESGSQFDARAAFVVCGEVPGAVAVAEAPAAAAGGEAWIESAMCTSCDECIRINNRIFAYNENKQAYVKNAKGGPFRDLVKAAEKCTAQIIHPGAPQDPGEKDLDKLVKRAAKYN